MMDWATRVEQEAQKLASEAWVRFRDQPEELARIDEIRRLAIDQIRDMTYSTAGRGRDRIGDEFVGHYSGYEEFEYKLPTFHPDQIAVSEALEGIMEIVLPGEDRFLVRCHYGGRMTQREIANMLLIGKSTVDRRLAAVREKLRTVLTARFGDTHAEVRQGLLETGQRLRRADGRRF